MSDSIKSSPIYNYDHFEGVEIFPVYIQRPTNPVESIK